MDTNILDIYKKQRTSLQKSFINMLNESLTSEMDEWNELPLIKKSIYRHKFDVFVSDTSKKIKEELTILRAIKKTNAEDVLRHDISDIIECKNAIPESRNPFEWTTKFRQKFLTMNCFARFVLFDRVDCKDLWDCQVMEKIVSSDMPTLEGVEFEKQTDILTSIVDKLASNPTNSKYVEDPSDEFLDTMSGQMSMNI